MTKVIYREPTFNVKEWRHWIRKFWEHAPIYSEGFTKDFLKKKELEKNMEGENGKRIPNRPEQVGEIQEKTSRGPGEKIPGGEVEGGKKEVLSFFDFKTKQKFETDKYEIMEKMTKKGKKRRFAIAIAPSGIKSSRALKEEHNEKTVTNPNDNGSGC